MRLKVILTAFGVAGLILLPSIYFHQASPPPTTPPPVAKDETRAAPALRVRFNPVRPEDHLPDAPIDSSRPTAQDHAAYVVERSAELGDLTSSGDPAALRTILSELNNPDPEIRRAALIATVDFGSQDAIPTLQNEMEWTPDPQEKVDLRKAIEFLQLPPALPDASP